MKKVVSFRPGFAFLALALAFAAGFALTVHPSSAAEMMRSFEAVYDIQPDGSMDVTETIVWDFGTAERHGIFRDLVTKQDCASDASTSGEQPEPGYEICKPGFERRYDLSVTSVRDENGSPYQYEVSDSGDGKRIKIGDPDRTITGVHTYVINYTVRGALDRLPSHDELAWNATGGDWTVTIADARITVNLPEGEMDAAGCFAGYFGDNTQCESAGTSGRTAVFEQEQIYPGQQLTIVARWPTGIVNVPPPILRDKPSVDDYFELDAWELGGFGVLTVAGIAAVVALWWRHGRDRAYRSLYYLTNDPTEGRRPLFAKRDIVVEYLPPDDLRPAQMGVILDERADTLDVTATIIDLAVRGHLFITEIPKKGWFGSKDWQLEKRQGEDELLPYEKLLYNGLFASSNQVRLSSLKMKFAARLAKVKDSLYRDAMKRKWFSRKPETSHAIWLGIALAVDVVGVGVTVLCGLLLGRALLGVPIIIAGTLLMIVSAAMKRRTAIGSEALRRVLGFRLYIVTAETRMQEFNEQQNIFAKYLPYAIVFGAVDKWAKAFRGLGDEEIQRSTASWYAGGAAFNAMSFSSNMRGFSDSVSSTISSSPRSSGSGGGGGAGGGGGGGGGGSW
ncbi:MAG: DUF2207 domain-containing protein [Hyphomicrobiales bacterium]